MRSSMKVLMVAATLVIALSVTAPLQASCVLGLIETRDASFAFSHLVNLQFQNHPYYGTGPYGPWTYVTGTIPAVSPVTALAKGSFWALGTGDQANAGSGNDSNTYDIMTAGGFGFYANPGVYEHGGRFAGNWNSGSIDGCIGGGNCMCLLVTDVLPGTDDAQFMVVGGRSAGTEDTLLNAGGTDGQNHLTPLKMVAIPRPNITGSTRLAGSNDVDLAVSLPALTGGVYSTPGSGCDCSPVGYRVVQSIVPRGTTVPTDRDRAATWDDDNNAGTPEVDLYSEPILTAGGAQPAAGTSLTGSVSVRSLCGSSDQDVYLTAQLVFDGSGGPGTEWVAEHLSGNSTRVECGPNLADPDDKPRPIRPRNDRPSPRRR